MMTGETHFLLCICNENPMKNHLMSNIIDLFFCWKICHFITSNSSLGLIFLSKIFSRYNLWLIELNVLSLCYTLPYLIKKHLIGCLASAWKKTTTRNCIVSSMLFSSLIPFRIVFRSISCSSVLLAFKNWLNNVLSSSVIGFFLHIHNKEPISA